MCFSIFFRGCKLLKSFHFLVRAQRYTYSLKYRCGENLFNISLKEIMNGEIMNGILYINKTGWMSIQISDTAQTLDCGTLFLMAGKFQKADHRLRIPCWNCGNYGKVAFIQIMLILLAALICAFSRLSHLSSRICARTLYVHRWLFQAKTEH